MKRCSKVINRSTLSLLVISALILVCIACMLILGGCGSKEAETPEKVPEVETPEAEVSDTGNKLFGEEPSSSEEESAESAKEDVAPEEDKDDDATVPLIPLKSMDYIDRADGRSVLFYAKYDLLSLGDSADEFLKLQKVLDFQNTDMKERMEKEADDAEPDAKAFRDDTEIEEPFYDVSRLFVKRADKEIFSYIKDFENYYGGVHGTNGCGGFNYYTATGEEIPLSDVIADTDRLKGVLADKLKKKYPDIDWFEDLNGVFSQYGDDGYPYNWVLGNRGITFAFNPYEIAAYAYGQQFVTIDYDEEPGLFTGKIKKNEGSFVEAFDLFQDVSVFNEFGEIKSLNVDAEYDYDSYGYPGDYPIKSITINYDGKSLTDSDFPVSYAFQHNMYVVHTEEGRNLLYIDCYQEDDHHSIASYELGEDGIKRLGETYGGFYVSSSWDSEGGWRPAAFDQNRFGLLSGTDMLSTVSIFSYYKVGSDGMPEALSDYYTILSDITLKSTKPIMAEFLGVAKDLSPDAPEVNERKGEVKKLPPGTGFKLWRTDAEAYVDCIVKENGKDNVYRLIQEFDGEGNRTVDGMNIEDCFEELFWAG